MGIMLDTYRKECYWAEALAMLRRVLLSAVAVVLFDSPLLRVASLSLVCALLATIHDLLRPFASAQANILERLSLLSLLILGILSTMLTYLGTSTVIAAALSVVLAVSLAVLFTCTMLPAARRCLAIASRKDVEVEMDDSMMFLQSATPLRSPLLINSDD